MVAHNDSQELLTFLLSHTAAAQVVFIALGFEELTDIIWCEGRFI